MIELKYLLISIICFIILLILIKINENIKLYQNRCKNFKYETVLTYVSPEGKEYYESILVPRQLNFKPIDIEKFETIGIPIHNWMIEDKSKKEEKLIKLMNAIN